MIQNLLERGEQNLVRNLRENIREKNAELLVYSLDSYASISMTLVAGAFSPFKRVSVAMEQPNCIEAFVDNTCIALDFDVDVSQ